MEEPTAAPEASRDHADHESGADGAPGAPAGSREESSAPLSGADAAPASPKESLAPRESPRAKSFVRDLAERFPWLGLALTAAIYLGGVVFRYWYIFSAHDPRKFVYSDMRMYVELARRLSQPNVIPQIGDITHPPGETWFLIYFFQHHPAPTMPEGISDAAVWANFIVCVLVPLATGALGWVAFGRTAGYLSTIFATIYYPFVEFGAFFLAEIHLAFTATVSITCYLLAMKLAAAPPSAKRTAGIAATALVGGFFFSLAMAFKMVAMPAIGGMMVVHFLLAKKPKHLMRLVIGVVFVLASAPVTYKLVSRCTAANHVEANAPGQFCTGSNKSASDFLLGHYDRIQSITWRDPKYPGVVGFGSPAAYQHGYRSTKTVPFLITNQPANNAEAWKWIVHNPFESLVLSLEHVWDCFATYPWPPNATGFWPGDYMFHFGFVGFILLPSIFVMVDVLRKRGVVGLFRSQELVVLSPIFGVCLSVFLATGEARYRIPWDAVFIVLAVEFYRRFRLRISEPPESEPEGLPGAT